MGRTRATMVSETLNHKQGVFSVLGMSRGKPPDEVCEITTGINKVVGIPALRGECFVNNDSFGRPGHKFLEFHLSKGLRLACRQSLDEALNADRGSPHRNAG